MLIDQILEYNKKFVETKEHEKYKTSKHPNKNLVVVSCMDTRLTELLQKAMNLKNGDAKILKTAGALVSHPFGSIMRSIIISIYDLNAREVCIVGHHDCGMSNVNSSDTVKKMIALGIPEDTLTMLDHSGVKINDWLSGFDSVSESVCESVNIVRNHPLVPQNVYVHGMIINPKTGALELIANGYEKEEAI